MTLRRPALLNREVYKCMILHIVASQRPQVR